MVDGATVVIYSTHHTSKADLKTWVMELENLRRIKAVLPAEAMNVTFLDQSGVAASQTIASSAGGTASVPVSTATGARRNNDYYQLPRDRSGSTQQGGSSASTGTGAGNNPDYYQLPKEFQDSLGYGGSSTK